VPFSMLASIVPRWLALAPPGRHARAHARLRLASSALARINPAGNRSGIGQNERDGIAIRRRVQSKMNSLSPKASKRCHIDGVEPGERIFHLRTRCAVDDDACGLQYFRKSLAKVRTEPLHVGHDSGGVLEALIDVADLSIITDCPVVIEHTYLIFPGRFNQLRH